MKTVPAILICIFLSSCSNLIHSQSTQVYMDFKADLVKSEVSTDNITRNQTPALLSIEQQKKDLNLTLAQDSTGKKNAVNYQLNNDFLFDKAVRPADSNYCTDRRNKSRHSYPNLRNDEKGGVLFRLSYDLGEQHKNFNYSGQENLTYLFGLSLGLGYYPWKNYCITLNGSLALKPFNGWDRTFGGPVVSSSTEFISLQLGTDLSVLHFDVGVQYNSNTIEKEVQFENSSGIEYWRTTYVENHRNLGLTCSAYLKFYEDFFIAMEYLPTLWVLDNGNFNSRYSDVILFKFGYSKSIHNKKKE
jgi:hypothetical protein